jgi:hypothetical protein
MLSRKGNVPSVDLPNASALWQAALDEVVGDPDFPPGMIEDLRSASVGWATVEVSRANSPQENAEENTGHKGQYRIG